MRVARQTVKRLFATAAAVLEMSAIDLLPRQQHRVCQCAEAADGRIDEVITRQLDLVRSFEQVRAGSSGIRRPAICEFCKYTNKIAISSKHSTTAGPIFSDGRRCPAEAPVDLSIKGTR